MNDLYTQEWRLYHNFFLPSVKLMEKTLVDGKAMKRYDQPKTPYQRVIESPYVSASVKRSLKEQFETLNPFRLRKAMEDKLDQVPTEWVILNYFSIKNQATYMLRP
jgi:hypothetical protein